MEHKVSLSIKEKIYRRCVKSAIGYESEAWCLSENMIAIFTTKRTMNLYTLGLQETVDILAKANAVRWYGHVMRRNSDDVLRKTLAFGVLERRGRGNQR